MGTELNAIYNVVNLPEEVMSFSVGLGLRSKERPDELSSEASAF